jgi:predicted Zn-dependent protease
MRDERLDRAEQLAGLKRHDEVLQILSDPALNQSPPAARLRVFALLNLDRVSEAHREADRLVALDPESPFSFLARSFSWEAKDQPWEALNDARAAVRLAPHTPLLRSRLATCLARSGQLDEAHEEVGWVLTQEPDYSDHWVLLGRVYYHLNRFDDAEGALLEALRLDPESSEAKVLLAGVLAETKGGRDLSISTLIGVLRENPSQASVRQMLLDIAFPRQLPWELLIILFGIAGILGPVVVVPLALTYGAVIAVRYRRLTPELRQLVMAYPTTRNRVRLAFAAWFVGVAGVAGIGLLLLL